VTSDECVDAVADAVAAHLAGDSRWSVARRVRWDGDPANPDTPYIWGVAVVASGIPFEAGPDGLQLPASAEPAFLLDLVSPDNWTHEYHEKPGVIYGRRVGEWVLFDPTGGRLRPSPRALRWDRDGHDDIFPPVGGAYFSRLGFRLDVTSAGVRIGPAGPPRLEERRLDLLNRLERASASLAATQRKVGGLETALAGVEDKLRAVAGPRP
jgi:hypothetical protein